MIKRTCGMPECGKPHRARGLCSTHYNQQHATTDQRHRKVITPCAWCSADCVKEPSQDRKYNGRFCSLACRDAWRKATGINASPSPEARAAAVAAKHGRRAKVRAKLKRAARGTQGRTWVAGSCERCGTYFIADARGWDAARFCSTRCLKRASRARRRARLRASHVERYSRAAIFIRDGWRCHLCRHLVRRTASVPHPLAPTIDHVVPLAKGGPDTAANVATAHFICNSTKGDRVGDRGDQLALLG